MSSPKKKDPQDSQVSYHSSVRRAVPQSVASDRERSKQLQFLDPRNAAARDAQIAPTNATEITTTENKPPVPPNKVADKHDEEEVENEPRMPLEVENDPEQQPQKQQEQAIPMDPEKAAAKRSLQFLTKEQQLAARDAQENSKAKTKTTKGGAQATTTTEKEDTKPAAAGAGGGGQFLTVEQRQAAQDAKEKEEDCRVAGYYLDGSTKEKELRVAGYLDGSSNNNNHIGGMTPTADGLRRGETVESAPGAVAVGGMDGSRYSNASYGGGNQEEGMMEESQKSHTNNGMDDSSRAGLAQAMPVLDESVKQADEVGLQPVLEEEDQKRFKRREEAARKNILIGLLVVSLFIVSIAIGSVVGLRSKKNDSGSVIPTAAPSVVPTQSPTASPTAYILDFPDFTMEKLAADPNSPQSRAYSWLLNDPYLETYPEWRQMQRFSLATFYYSTGGDTSWERNDDWLNYEVSECEWFNKGNMRLQLMHMKGTLSQLVANLFLGWYRYNSYEDFGSFWEGGDELEYYDFPCGASPEQEEDDPDHAHNRFRRFWLHNNVLDGPIPDQVGLLTSLEDWGMAHNPKLRGTMPTEIGRLTNLWHMALEDCGFETNLPSEIGLLTNMITLSLVAQPGLKGKLPSEIGLLSNKLMYFDVPITEPLPTEIGLLTNLEFFSPQSSTAGMGSINSELGLLTKLRLMNILDSPLLEGTIPTEIGQLSLLEMGQIRGTAVSGSLPSVLGQLSLLKVLLLDHNSFTGTLPEELTELKDLEEFVIDGNPLDGPLPGSFGDTEWTNLELMSLTETYVTGNIPNHSCPYALFDCSESLCGCDCACSATHPN